MAKKVKKDEWKWIRENLLTFAYDDDGDEIFSFYNIGWLTGPIPTIIARLNKAKLYYEEKGYRDIHIKLRRYTDETDAIGLTGARQESQEAYEKRIARNKKAAISAAKSKKKRAEAKEKRDREEYKRLQKKFKE